MLEKLLLAVSLTLTLTLFAEISLSSSHRTTGELNQPEHPVWTVSQRNGS